MSDLAIQTKTCSKCHETKEVALFYKSKKSKDGYNGYCKACRNEYSAQYRKSEKWKSYIKDYQKSDKGKESMAGYRKSEKYKAKKERRKQTLKSDPVAYAKSIESMKKYQKSEKGIKTKQKYRNSEKHRLAKNKDEQKARDNLSDRYIRKTLVQCTNLKHQDIPQSLVEMKRAELKIKRQLKEMTA